MIFLQSSDLPFVDVAKAPPITPSCATTSGAFLVKLIEKRALDVIKKVGALPLELQTYSRGIRLNKALRVLRKPALLCATAFAP